jgi:endonuclease/exonuclease/phosphatase family metal-dependent hydrolase
MDKIFTVGTYNIAHGLNFSTFDVTTPAHLLPVTLEETAKVIRALDVDILGLNEVFNTGGGALDLQTETLAKLSNKPYHVFGEAILFLGNPSESYGNAFLSEKRIISHTVVKVPSPVGDERRPEENEYYEDRAVLCVQVQTNFGIVTVLITHFGLNGLEQERMVQALVKLIDDADTPVVLMGDFNVQPDNPVLQPIYDRLQNAAKVLGNNEYTFATYKPYQTIDYIFVSNEFEILDYQVMQNRTSDHRPCKAALAWKGK